MNRRIMLQVAFFVIVNAIIIAAGSMAGIGIDKAVADGLLSLAFGITALSLGGVAFLALEAYLLYLLFTQKAE